MMPSNASTLSPSPWLKFAAGLMFAAGCLSACSANVDPNDVRSEQQQLLTPVYRINSGGDAISPFAGDQYYSGDSNFYYSGTPVATSGVVDAAPANVYQIERFGNFSYTFSGLTAGAHYVARLHFAEIAFTQSGRRVFNVNINSTQVLGQFDIFAAVGGNRALVKDFDTEATSGGKVVVSLVSLIDNAKISAIEILAVSGAASAANGGAANGGAANGGAASAAGAVNGGAGSSAAGASSSADAGNNAGMGNQAPTIANPASATMNPNTPMRASLSVLGADDGSESNLTYAWGTTGSPPADVGFSDNGSNSAKNVFVNFTKAGSYALVATVRDGAGLTASSHVTVVIGQTGQISSVQVTPGSGNVNVGGSLQFSAIAKDQSGNTVASTATWSVSGGGSINSNGLFSAGSSSGTHTITASTGSVSGKATVTVNAAAPAASPVSYITDFNLSENPVWESGVWRNGKSTGLDWSDLASSNGLAFGTQIGTLSHYNDSLACLSGFPANQGASGTVHVNPNGDPGQYHELEILVRWDIAPHVARGYEFNYAYDGRYWDIVRWNGALDNYTVLGGSAAGSSGPPLASGDVLTVTAIGNLIRAYRNGQLIASVTDSTWTDGNPGMGSWRRNGSSFPTRLSYTHFEAFSIQ